MSNPNVGIKACLKIPKERVKTIFIHHSCGSLLIDDSAGRLGSALDDRNFFLSSTNYGWGPDGIGDITDAGHLWKWFRGEKSSVYMEALYNEFTQYPKEEFLRTEIDTEDENEVIMFKSCFPNSRVSGNPSDPIPDIENNLLKGENFKSEHHKIANIKGIYIDLLEYFKTRTDKLFIALTAPPVLEADYSQNARALNNWLVYEWLKDYPHNNVRVIDFFNILTSSDNGTANISDQNKECGNHHRVYNGVIQHVCEDETKSVLCYPIQKVNNHPNPAGNVKATSEIADLILAYYNDYKGISD